MRACRVVAYCDSWGVLTLMPPKKVNAWRCAQCHDIGISRKKAETCCDDEATEREEARAKASRKKKVASILIRIEQDRDYRDRLTGGKVAVANCPHCKRRYAVAINYARREWDRNSGTLKPIHWEKARRQARNLVKAQLARHLPCRQID
jgi:hypothetical protein